MISPVVHRRSVLRAAAASGMALCLPPARACEFFSAYLRVTHPWTRATAAGETSAVICMEFDQVTVADRLIRVASPVASGAEMSRAGARMSGVDFHLPAWRASALTEAGIQLRLVGLKFPLETGREYPLTLEFEKGGMVDATLSVDYESVA